MPQKISQSGSALTSVREKEIIKKALLSRKVEETFLDLFSKGKIAGTVHTCIGQEFSGAVIGSLLEKGDSVFSNHRCHGHFLSFIGDTNGLIAEIMGKATGVCGGRGGSQHLCKDGFYSSGIQGGIAPISAGLAFARKLKKENKISVVFIGDGTLGEGALYETMNIATLWNLPILFVLEHNGMAQSTETKHTIAGDTLKRAEAFDIKSGKGNTWEWRELYSQADEMVRYVRNESRPAFLQVDTFRLKAHSKGDDTRPRSEVEKYEKIDPLNKLIEDGFEGLNSILGEIEVEVGRAVALADAAPLPTWAPTQEVKQPLTWTPAQTKRRRLGVAINECFKTLMGQDKKVMFLGEDVLSPYGGAFKISQDLSSLYPDQVMSTPISEAAIVGIGTGLALEGLRPFVEIMFGDFITLAFDQILNHSAKFEDMYNGQVRVNTVVRTPMGGGRGYGPTHSQTLEKHFLGIPGLRVIAVNHLMEPAPIYNRLVTDNVGSTLLVENKKQYAMDLVDKAPDGFEILQSNCTFPCVYIKPQTEKVDITLLGYGGVADLLVQCCQRLFEEHDIVAQVLCPTQIYPFEIEKYLGILQRSANLALIEEGQGFASFSAEILAQLATLKTGMAWKVARVAAPPVCIPSCGPLEKQILPSLDSVVKQVVSLVKGDA